MAKLEFSGIGITSARGRIGSETISRNAHSNYIKSALYGTVFPNNEWTINFTQYHQDSILLWKQLDPFHQELWNHAASEYVTSNSLGQRIRLSGFNYFLRQTVGIFSTGNIPSLLPVVDVAVTPPIDFFVDILDLTVMAVTVRFPSTLYVVPPDHAIFIGASPPQSSGRTRLSSNIGLLLFDVAGVNIQGYDLITAYTALRPPLSVGDKVFFKCYTVNVINGLRSPELRTSGVVV